MFLKNSIHTAVQRVFQSYYEDTFLQTLQSYSRSFLLGLLLLIGNCVCVLSLLISEKSIKEMAETDSDFVNLNFIVLFKSYEHDIFILEVFLALNSVFILLSVSSFSFHIADISGFRNVVSSSSFIAQIYNHIILIPSCYFSMNLLSKSSISYLNLIFTLLIGKQI